jgi:hypothetical protein
MKENGLLGIGYWFLLEVRLRGKCTIAEEGWRIIQALAPWWGPRAILEKMMNQPDAQLVEAKFEDSTA